jgi:hypothetical protein
MTLYERWREFGFRSTVRWLWLKARIGVVRFLIRGPLVLDTTFHGGITINLTGGYVIGCTIYGADYKRPPRTLDPYLQKPMPVFPVEELDA